MKGKFEVLSLYLSLCFATILLTSIPPKIDAPTYRFSRLGEPRALAHLPKVLRDGLRQSTQIEVARAPGVSRTNASATLLTQNKTNQHQYANQNFRHSRTLHCNVSRGRIGAISDLWSRYMWQRADFGTDEGGEGWPFPQQCQFDCSASVVGEIYGAVKHMMRCLCCIQPFLPSCSQLLWISATIIHKRLLDVHDVKSFVTSLTRFLTLCLKFLCGNMFDRLRSGAGSVLYASSPGSLLHSLWAISPLSPSQIIEAGAQIIEMVSYPVIYCFIAAVTFSFVLLPKWQVFKVSCRDEKRSKTCLVLHQLAVPGCLSQPGLRIGRAFASYVLLPVWTVARLCVKLALRTASWATGITGSYLVQVGTIVTIACFFIWTMVPPKMNNDPGCKYV